MDRFKQESLNLLSNIADSISKATDAQTLSDALFRVVDDFVDVPYSSIFLWDFQENRLRLYANKGFSQEDRLSSERTAMDRHPGWVFTHREAIHVRDMDNEPIPGFVQSGPRAFKVRSRLWLPISTTDRSLGAFGFASQETDFFTDEHKNILNLVCRLAGNIYSNIVFSQSEKQYIEDIKISMKKIQDASNAQQNFIAKMSHEMRTPLNGIIGMSELLKNTKLAEDQTYLVDIINDQSVILLSLINDILDISKIETEEFRLVRFPFNLIETLQSTIKSHSLQAQQKGLKLIEAIDPYLQFFVLSDALRFSQIINNLISNAIKFTREGQVRISAKLLTDNDTNCRICLEVEDSGIGIDPEKLDAIFGRFVQADDSISRNQGGSGLGLYITRELIHKMGGFIEAKSTPGEGSTFRVELEFEKVKDSQSSSKASSSYVFNDLRILVVEDNIVNSFYLQSVLQAQGAGVECATDGQQAVDLCREKSFDLILMDLQMPIMDGITASANIRNELKNQTPILAQSANTVQKDIEACYAAGVNDYISKPFSPSQLSTKIALMLKLQSREEKEKSVAAETTETHPIRQKALELSHQNVEMAENLLRLFIRELPKTKLALREAQAEKDLKILNKLGHKYKSSFRLFNLEEAALLCLRLEKTTEESLRWEEVEELISGIERIANSIIKEFVSLTS
jgi:signal transduction histidine kinase/CheY-like chemotaxis protein/HPt (histidine-containing phosphotransfer) domain-containing protein